MKPESLHLIQEKTARMRKQFEAHVFQKEVISEPLKEMMDELWEIDQICKEEIAESSLVPVSQRTRLQGNKKGVLKIAYAMSRFDYPLINLITGNDYNQSEAFKYLEGVTGVKHNTIKNMRDRFDKYLTQERSNRKGWDAPLLPEYKKVMDLYSEMGESSVAKEILEILDR